MTTNERKGIYTQCDKLINRYLIRGRNIVNYTCFPYGQYNAMMSGEPDAHFISDFQYFVFTKSTKSLESIRALLHIGHIEDVFILLRTMFEGYLASRYIDENYDVKLLSDFIFVPQLIAHRKVIYQNNEAIDRRSNELVDFFQRNPSDLKLGKDKSYFYDLYGYLCNYAHCNYSIADCYIEGNGMYTCDKVTNDFMAKILTLFVYTKTFESIVTVEGEDFYSQKVEKDCYKLVEEVTSFLHKHLDYLSRYECKDVNPELNKHMKNMFKNMKKSLKEEIGSVKKDFLNEF